MRILIFGGTTEGRLLSRRLAEAGADITVCVATEYGREEQGEAPGVTVLTGRRDRAEIETLLRDMDLCVDATHPYALSITETVQAACDAVGVPLRRLLREDCGEAESDDGCQVVVVDSAADAAVYLKDRPGNVLLATGVKELPAFAELEPDRLYPRILPTAGGLAACEAAGIPHRNIIAMQGPFSRELNEALIRQFSIRYLVTKDGGGPGGYPEKRDAARNTGAVLVLLRRRRETGERYEAVAAYCEELLQREAASSCG